jgi:uncharacterized protein DUF4157
MARWMYPPELQRPRERDRFDPLVEGARYCLPCELSLAIWERVCADATDSAGRRDEAQARQQFQKLATRIAARGGRLRPDVGKFTRVGVEINGDSLGAWSVNELKSRTPGRETLVIAEARRWAHISGEPTTALKGSEGVEGTENPDEAMTQHELPGVSEVKRALAALQLSTCPDETTPPRASSSNRMSRWLEFTPPSDAKLPGSMATPFAALPAAVMRSAERTEIDHEAAELVARARRGGAPLNAALQRQLEAALGTRLDNVRVHTDSEADAAARALHARAFAIGDDMFFRDGEYDPTSRYGQRLIAHETAHTVHARRASAPADRATMVSQPGDALEHEADAFADAFVHDITQGLRGGTGPESDEPRVRQPAELGVGAARGTAPKHPVKFAGSNSGAFIQRQAAPESRNAMIAPDPNAGDSWLDPTKIISDGWLIFKQSKSNPTSKNMALVAARRAQIRVWLEKVPTSLAPEHIELTAQGLSNYRRVYASAEQLWASIDQLLALQKHADAARDTYAAWAQLHGPYQDDGRHAAHVPAGARVHIDLFGEGRFPEAVNIGIEDRSTTTGKSGTRVPNLIYRRFDSRASNHLPIADHSADLVTSENGPIAMPGLAEEIVRIIAPGGTIVLYNPVLDDQVPDVTEQIHRKVAEATKGKVTSIRTRTATSMSLETRILVPK